MQIVCSLAIVLVLSLSALGQAKRADDMSLLKPSDGAYAEASNAAAIFKQLGLNVQSIHRSKLEGFFRGTTDAAFFKTDKGAFEIIFFNEPGQAEKIRVIETRDGKRYIYSFEGQPQPDPHRDVFNAAYPMRFIMIDKLFVVVFNNDDLYQVLKEILR
jgi:hypothetical protein